MKMFLSSTVMILSVIWGYCFIDHFSQVRIIIPLLGRIKIKVFFEILSASRKFPLVIQFFLLLSEEIDQFSSQVDQAVLNTKSIIIEDVCPTFNLLINKTSENVDSFVSVSCCFLIDFLDF